MKNIFFFLLLFSINAFGQQIDRVYKENGIWKGDLSQPIGTYPIKGAIIADTSQIPDPAIVVPIPPPTLTTIDNADPRMIYTGGGWYSGPTTAPGFYPPQSNPAPTPPLSTMAYASAAGNVLTFTFTGTAIEVYCEKKPGHGSGAFQVDNLQATTLNLGVAGPTGSTKVFDVDSLANGQHTFKLSIVGSGNVVFDYVKINGTAVTPPTPPVTGDIIVLPGQSIKAAVESAAAPKKVLVKPGTYAENIINVPLGVSVVTEGSDKTFINFTGSHPLPWSGNNGANYKVGIFQLKSDSRANGNQTLSGFTIYGKNLATGGILVSNRDNVIVTDMKVQDTNFFGGWANDAAALQWFNCSFLNTSWASDGWCSGELNVFNLTGMNIHHNTFTNNLKDAQGRYIKGYGIKAMWPNGSLSGKIESNTFALAPNSIWKGGNGPNIDIEFHDTFYATGDILVKDNNLTNMVSATGNKQTGNTGRLIVEGNRFTLQTGSTCHVEVACNNITVRNNIMRGAPIVTANFKANGKWTDAIVDGNDFVSNGANPGWGGTFLIGPDGANMTITNNKFKNLGNYTFIKYMGTPATSSIVVGSGNCGIPGSPACP